MANSTKTQETVEAKSVETKKTECSNCKVLQMQIKNLQDSYQTKCKEYDQLLAAYRSLALRFGNAAEATKTFVKSLSTSIDLLYPIDKKGE